MARAKPGFDWAALDEHITQASLTCYTARPPADSISTNEFASRYKIPRATALGRLHRMEKLGLVECVGTFYIRLMDLAGKPYTGRMLYWRNRNGKGK